MAIERRDQFYKVCRVAFELAYSGLKPYNLNSGEVYIKNLGWLQSDDFRVRKIITSILGYTKGTPDTIFESLKEGIRAINGGRIFNQIENLNNSRMCVLLVGKEDDLIKGVASYISNLYSTDCLLERNYSGLPEKYIIKNLLQPNPEHPRKYSLFDLYLKNTNVLFLRGLENLSSNTLKHIAREIDDTTNINGRRGVLIIGTDDIASLPDYFVRQFEVINLEPEKQGVPAIAPQDKPKNHVSTPEKTQWHEIEISFIDSENVSISIKVKSIKKNYAEMGFKDLRTCKPVKSWYILFDFSKHECLKFPLNTKDKTEKAIQDLRKRLKTYFGIQSNPIILEHGYKPVFKVSMSESQSRSVRAFLNSNSFEEKEDD